MGPDLELALAAAGIADEITLSYFRLPSLAVEAKSDMSPVSEADRKAEAAVRRYIAGARPDDAVLGEEMGITGAAARRWVLDPIDGTANYVRGVPVWATLLALEVDGEVELGVVSAPALGRRWWAQRGRGAFAGPPGGQAQPVHVSTVGDLAQATLTSTCLADFPDPQAVIELARRAARDRAFGDFWSHVLVAEGSCEIGLDPIVSVWDVAALQVIVEEAGGRFTDFAGARRLDGGSAVSSNGLLHDEALRALSPRAGTGAGQARAH